MRGRHQGDYRGTVPSGNPIEVVIYREYVIRKGKIAEHWALFDTATILLKIAYVPILYNYCKIS